MIDSDHPSLSIARQCQLLSISRSGFYYQPSGESELNLTLMRLIDEQHMRTPYYGARQMARHLRREGYVVGRKRIRRLMQKMGLCVVYQRPRTTVPAADHEVYPYLLRDLVIDRPNQVWCADITYIQMRRGFLYLVDRHSEGSGREYIHGWQGAVDGQCVHRAAMAVAEIRVRLSARV
jgi:putative transposase